MGDYDNVLGFTPDSSHIIVKRNDSYWLFSLPDLNQQPYLPDTRGVSGVTDAGAKNGRQMACPTWDLARARAGISWLSIRRPV